MKVTVLEKIPEDPAFILDWNNLVFRMERPEVFFTHQWALAASRAFSASLRPLIFTAYEGGRLCGVAALAVAPVPPHAAIFLTASTADYCDIVSEPETRTAVLTAVLEEMRKLNIRDLVLANVPAQSHTLHGLAAAAGSHGFYLYERAAYDCGIISLGDKEQRQIILRHVMRKKNERHGLKKLGQFGPVRLTHLSAEQLEIGLDSIFAAHISRFLTANRLSPLIRSDRRFFLMELGKLLSSAGWMKVSQLEVNGRPVAWNYGFRFFDSWFWYLPTFDMDYEEPSPGCCLLRLLTEEACADPSVKRLDLGLGVEAYKMRFSNAVCSTRYVQLSMSLPRHLGNAGRHWLASTFIKFPTMEKQLRNGRELLLGLQSRIGETGAVATAGQALTRAKRSLFRQDKITIFEAPRFDALHVKTAESENMALEPLNWKHIACSAMSNADDGPTLEYLSRCAERMKGGRAAGYCLLGQATVPAHFLWVGLYNGFELQEIDSKLESSDLSAVMLFDCWTPAAERGNGHYVTAIRMAAAYLQKQQRQVWILSTAENEPCVQGILEAGFVYRFSLVRNTKLVYSTLSRRESTN